MSRFRKITSGKRARRLFGAGLASGLAVLGSTSAAHAQAASDSGSASATTVGEVIVTATMRDVQLREVAASVGVVTGEALAAAGPITNTGDILATIPGVRFNNLQSPHLSEITIRGSGTQRATSADPAIGLFSNGAYVGGGGGYGRNFAVIDSFDLERAEVLSGPQAALYGRNAEYGTINLISHKPTFTDTQSVAAAYTFETKQARLTAIINHAFSDELAIRVGVQAINQTGGFFYNPNTDSYYDSTNGYLARAQIRWRHENWDVGLLIERQDLRLPEFATVHVIPGGNVYPLIPNGFVQDKYILPQNGQHRTSDNINNINLFVKYDFGAATLTTTTMVRSRDSILSYDSDYIDLAAETALQQSGARGMYPLAQFTGRANAKFLGYQDVHLAGLSFQDNLSWVVGAEYMQFENDSTVRTVANPCATNASPNIVIGNGICGGTPTQPICYLLTPTARACPNPYPSQFGSMAYNDQVYKSGAIYASLSYKIGRLTMAGDIRYTKDNKKGLNSQFALYTNEPFRFNTGGTVTNPTLLQYKKSIVTWNGTVSYKIPGSWDNILYVKAGTGYRAGGFNFANSPPNVTPVPIRKTYDNEDTTSYEAGLKGNFTPRVYFTLAAYRSRTEGGLAAVGNGCTVTNACQQGAVSFNVNGGTVKAAGVEAQVATSLDVAGGVLSLDASGSNQVAKYREVPTTFNGLPLVDTQVAQTPHWLASVTVNFRRPMGDDTEAFANFVYHGQWGGVQDAITRTSPATPLSTIQNVDMRSGVQYKGLEVALFVKNLTNQSFPQIRFNQATAGPGIVAVPLQVRWNLPRTIGLEAKYDW